MKKGKYFFNFLPEVDNLFNEFTIFCITVLILWYIITNFISNYHISDLYNLISGSKLEKEKYTFFYE